MDPRDLPILPRLTPSDMVSSVRRLMEQSSASLAPLVQERSGGRYTGSIAILPVLRALEHKEQMPLVLDTAFKGLVRGMQLNPYLNSVVEGALQRHFTTGTIIPSWVPPVINLLLQSEHASHTALHLISHDSQYDSQRGLECATVGANSGH